MQYLRFKRSLLNQAVVAGLIGGAIAPAVMAREQAASVAPVGVSALDKVIVTPQKRLQALQSAPLTVSVVQPQLLNDHGVLDLSDLSRVVSGLTVSSTQSSGHTTVRLRGVGSSGDNPGLASSVGVVVDGVQRARVWTAFDDLDQIERIEVLKGPQDVLFGRNNTAGVINVVTKRPSHETSSRVQLTLGDFGQRSLSASFNSGLDESSALRLYASARERDGFLDVDPGAGPREELEDSDLGYYAFRGQLLVQPNANLDVNFSIDYAKRDDDCCAAVTLVRGVSADTIDTLATGTGVAPIANPFARVAWSNRSTAQEIDDLGGAIQADWKNDWFGGSTLTSITSLRRWETVNGADLDFSSADLFYREPNDSDALTHFDTLNQELRLAGTEGAVDWLFGVHYTHERLDRREAYRIGTAYESALSVQALRRINPILAASPTAPLFLSQATGRPVGTVFAGHAAQDFYEQDTSTFAIFTNNSWRATSDLEWTLGLRYTFEDKELTSRHNNPNGGLGCGGAITNPAQVVAALVARGLTVAQASAAAPAVTGQICLPWTNVRHNGRATVQDIDDGDWSGTLKAAYRFSEQAMAYVSASRGYKAAGFNLDRVQTNTGLPNGGEGTFPVDDTSFKDETVSAYELGARTTWMDGNLLLNVTAFLQEYSDYQYSSLVSGGTVIRSIPELSTTGVDAEIMLKSGALTIQSGLTYADTKFGNDLLPGPDLVLLPNSRASFAPEWLVNGSVSYDWRIDDTLDLRATVGAHYVSDHNTGYDLNPQKQQDSYALVDARLALGDRDGAWKVELWAQNLTDEDYVQAAFDAPLQDGSVNGFLGAPRTFGATLRVGH